MSTYVISDIHGCFDEFMQLLQLAGFTPEDTLILAGDYTDRGTQNIQMLDWLAERPDNVIAIKGNHDVGFVNYVGMLEKMAGQKGLALAELDDRQLGDLYQECLEWAEHEKVSFDRYRTIRNMLEQRAGELAADLCRWAAMLDAMPYLWEMQVNGRSCIVIHAGYIEDYRDPSLSRPYKSQEYFYIWARDDAYLHGGIRHGMIVAGHNPTIEDSLFTYAGGQVFRYYDEEKDCIFYDIDCGGVYRTPDSDFACLRLEDEKIFYLNRE